METRRHISGGLVLAVAALLCLAGCKKDEEGEKVVLGVDFEQTAGMQKTYIGNGDKTIYWSTDDQVQVNGTNYLVHDGVVEVNMCDDGYAAVYPATNTLTYSSETHSGKTCIGGTVVIPATQIYTADDNGIQQLNGPMAARLDTKTGRLLFRNLYAVIKVTVEPDHNFTLHNIQITADAQNLAGTQSFTFSAATNTASPTLGTLTTTSKSVTLTGIDSFIPVGERAAFYLYTAAPVDESKLTVTLNGSESLKYEKTKPGGINIPRSALGATTIAVNMAVDLGLPSGTLWATCNVGASKPEEYGKYYAWGETAAYGEEMNGAGNLAGENYAPGTVKTEYSFNYYKWGSGENNLGKYVDKTGYGMTTPDNKKILESEDDAAATNWGGSWRMPTAAEMQELVANCTWTWETVNEIPGYRVSGNGNSIFLPAAGRYSTNASCDNLNVRGYYFTSSLSSMGARDAVYLRCETTAKKVDEYAHREQGFSVRPVMSKPSE